MQSYRLLAAVPLNESDNALLEEMESTTFSADLQAAAEQDDLQDRLKALQYYWRVELEPALRQAKNIEQVRGHVTDFVERIDQLVTSFDRMTELRLLRVIQLQLGMAIFMGFLIIFTVIWLYQRLIKPWQALLVTAQAIGQRDFTHPVQVRGRNEMAILGMALNSMSTELAASYASLEQRVNKKTARLEQKKQILSFLYQANRRLHSQAPLCQRLSSVLSDLQHLTPLQNIELRVYEYEDDENYQEYTHQPDDKCTDQSHTNSVKDVHLPGVEMVIQKFRLTDNHIQYGLVLAQLPRNLVLTNDEQQLILTLMEQLTVTLALERQYARKQQIMVMEERSAIARELHDSIVQSLSCLKMQVSCLQMQSGKLSTEMQTLLGQMRNELNTSWQQLRELLTTFRLQLAEPGLHPALEACRREFSEKLGFNVSLDYQVPPYQVSAHQTIHLVQIAREALNNSFKHSGATACGISVIYHQKQITLTLWDNGRGISDNGERQNHYGMIIMRDRAQILNGDYQVDTRPGGGTRITVSFHPEVSTGAGNE